MAKQPKNGDAAVGRIGGKGLAHGVVYNESAGNCFTLCEAGCIEGDDNLCPEGTRVTCRACKRTFGQLAKIMEAK